ncbi:uncharacterized protein LOC128206809 [Mya arenaria]|uniref:uncharacterized protein LOC128206809 n=1 Tax=Mya arenaria TaxID=6604 RepID=UPI0022DFF5EA|nr:uncharacterized protein LOC128206809 [Mya arenaria]
METSTPTVRTRTRRSKGTPKAIPISPIPKIASQLERDSIEATPVKDISDVIDNDKVTPCSKSYSKRERKPRQWKNLEVQESDKKGQLGNGQKKDAGSEIQDVEDERRVEEKDENNEHGQDKSDKIEQGSETEPALTEAKSVAKKKSSGRKKSGVTKTNEEVGNANVINNSFQDQEKVEAELVEVKVSPTGKKRGRKRKSLNGDKSIEGENDASITENTTPSVHNVSESKRGRKRKVVNYAVVNSAGVDEVRDANSEASKTDAVDTGMKRRGRKRKAEHQNDGDSSQNFGDESLKDTSLNSTLGDKANTSSRGRKRKAAMNDSSVTNKEDKVKTNASAVGEGLDNTKTLDGAEDGDQSAKKTSGTGKKKTKAEQTQAAPYQCRHCEYEGIKSAMESHSARVHHLWWTIANMDGSSETHGELMNILKHRKVLECKDCGKTTRFPHYYKQHRIWCGREHLTYTCEHCNKDDLKLMWKQVHINTCPALREIQEIDAPVEDKSKLDEDVNKEVTPGGRKKRKAAKKAEKMVADISKDMQPSRDSDVSDVDDPEVKLEDADESDDDAEEFEVDEDVSNDEDDAGEDDEEDEGGGNKIVYAHGKGYSLTVNLDCFKLRFYAPTLENMKKFNKKDLFPQFLPHKTLFQPLSESESVPFRPICQTSVSFTVGKQAEHTQLETGTGSIIEGFPIFYTGLEVWKLAWCPMPLGSKHEQILAVVGKTNPKTRFCGEKTYSGPGVIQIWCTGVTCNSRLSRTAPRQLYTLVHDFGLATGLKWCPTGVWQSKCHSDETYRRIGLIAVSMTDGTVRIFSIPDIQADQETPLTLKVKPLLTLVPNRTPVNCGLVCTALDWDPSQGHPRILAGYTDGSVRIFNLIECSPLLKLSSEEGEKLLPVATHQIHAFPVRTVTWIASLTNIVVTSSEGLDSHFWDVENPQVPLYTEEYCCAMSSCSSRLVQGVFLASDDNYALNTNKARYRECHTLMYIGAPGQAKKRVPDILCYYLGNLYCCIWDITFSDWLCMSAQCDNKGRITATPMRDVQYTSPDTKTYKFRMKVCETNVTFLDSKEDLNQTHICAKCQKNQSTKSLQSDSQPKISQSQKTLENGQTKECSQSEESLQNNREKTIQPDKTDKCTCSEQKKSKPCLNYMEYVDMYHRLDQVRDDVAEAEKYDQPPTYAFKAVQFNPNQLQCCWLAYGGTQGIVRLVNLFNIFPEKSKSMFTKYETG